MSPYDPSTSPAPVPAGAFAAAARAGAAESRLAELFAAHREAVYRAAFRIAGNPSDAEDVMQTVFLRVWRREGDGLALDAVGGAYLRRAAVNAALDVVRSRGRAGWAPLEEAEGPWTDAQAGEPAPERAASLARLRKALRAAIARLSPRAAEMFALRYFEGLGPAEIGELLGTSPGVVSVLLHRTRARLARELTKTLGGRS